MCMPNCYVCQAVDQQITNIAPARKDGVVPLSYRKLPKRERSRIINPR